MNATGMGGSGDPASRELDRPTFTQHARLRALEEQLYGHVLEAIDFDALAGLEQVLFEILTRRMRIGTELALDLTTVIIERALVRASEDAARYTDCGPPPGITEAERKAVAFDASCPFCRVAAERDRERGATSATGSDTHGFADEPCECCEMVAEQWRDEHREVLAKAGLAPAAPTGSAGTTSAADADRELS